MEQMTGGSDVNQVLQLSEAREVSGTVPTETVLVPEQGRETNDSQEKLITPDEDTSNDTRPTKQHITAVEPSFVTIDTCQPTSLISPDFVEVEELQSNGCERHYCTPSKMESSAETKISAISDLSGQHNCDISMTNQEVGEPSECLLPSSDPKSAIVNSDPSDEKDSRCSAVRQVLDEIIDEAIMNIEPKTVKQELTKNQCDVSSISEGHGIENSKSEPRKRSTALLNVSFASPLESCHLYTPSPVLSVASTVHITPESDTDETSEEVPGQVTWLCEVRSDTDASRSISENPHQSPIADEECYHCTVTHNNFPNTELTNVEQGLSRLKSIEVRLELVVGETVKETSDDKFEPIASSRHDEDKRNEKMNHESVEVDNNSDKTNASYEATQNTSRDCQIHYLTKQMLPKIEKDMICSSYDLFDATDNQQNICSTDTQKAVSGDLFSPSPQVSTKLSCHGNEMENHRQSDDSGCETTLKSTKDLSTSDLGEKGSSIFCPTEVKNIIHRLSDQSTKFTSSAELFSLTPDHDAVGLLKSQSKATDCRVENTDNTDRNLDDSIQHNLPGVLHPESPRKIIETTFDHLDRSQEESLKVPLDTPKALECDIIESDMDNGGGTSVKSGNQQEHLEFQVESVQLTSDNPIIRDDKDKNLISEVRNLGESTTLANSLLGKCVSGDVDAKDETENIGSETLVNKTEQLHQNPVTNEHEAFVLETSPVEEVRKIDGAYTQENHLIDSNIEFSVKDSAHCTSPERPKVKSLMNVSYLDQQSRPDSNLTVTPETKMTNEMCVSPAQIKANELQTVLVGLSGLEENVLKEINLDSLHQTSMPSSEKDLLPQVTATRQSTQQGPAESIPLKLDQSLVQELKCAETTSFGAKSKNLISGDQYEKTIANNLPEVPVSTPALKKSQESTDFNEACDGLMPQSSHNPILQEHHVEASQDDDFPDSGISNSSRSSEEEARLVDCTRNELLSEKLLLDVSPFPLACSEPVEHFANPTNQVKDKSASDTEAEIQQLVNILLNGICNEKISAVEDFRQSEPAENCDQSKVSTQPSRPEEIDENERPPNKLRKLNVSSAAVNGKVTLGSNGEFGMETDVYYRDGDVKSERKLLTDDPAESQNDMRTENNSLLEGPQTEHLPLKKRNIPTESQETADDECQKCSFNDNMNCNVIQADVKENEMRRYEMGKSFPAPSQPQYVLYDDLDESDSDDSQEVEESTFWLNYMMASQPQYNLLDRDHTLGGRRITPNPSTVELQRELNRLRRPSSSIKNDMKEAGKLKTDDQQVPAMSPMKDLVYDQSHENTSMYPKLPEKKIVYPTSACQKLESVVGSSAQRSSPSDMHGISSLGSSFRWKGNVEADYDSAAAISDVQTYDDEACVPEVPEVLPRLQPCGRPVRIGLSRRQKVARLHPYWKFK